VPRWFVSHTGYGCKLDSYGGRFRVLGRKLPS
jgi:hypothetical protein